MTVPVVRRPRVRLYPHLRSHRRHRHHHTHGLQQPSSRVYSMSPTVPWLVMRNQHQQRELSVSATSRMASTYWPAASSTRKNWEKRNAVRPAAAAISTTTTWHLPVSMNWRQTRTRATGRRHIYKKYQNWTWNAYFYTLPCKQFLRSVIRITRLHIDVYKGGTSRCLFVFGCPRATPLHILCACSHRRVGPAAERGLTASVGHTRQRCGWVLVKEAMHTAFCTNWMIQNRFESRCRIHGCPVFYRCGKILNSALCRVSLYDVCITISDQTTYICIYILSVYYSVAPKTKG